MLSFFAVLRTATSKISLETKTAVNKLATRPTISVVAYPLMGPVPNWNRKMAEMMVVRLESKIALKARLNPVAIEFKMPLPRAFSSLILSKMRTLASPATPTDGVRAEGRPDRPFLQVADARGERARLEHDDQVLGFFDRKPAPNDSAGGGGNDGFRAGGRDDLFGQDKG